MIRTVVPLAVALTLVPQAAWGDEPGQAAAGTNVPMVIGGAVALAAGIAFLVARRQRPLGIGLLVVGVAVATLGFVLPRIGGGAEVSTARVSILEPEAGAEVPAGEPVTVRVEVHGGTIATSPTEHDGGHLHLYVDGQLQQMPYSKTAEIELEPGRHDLKVEYVDPEHISFEPEVATTIEVMAA